MNNPQIRESQEITIPLSGAAKNLLRDAQQALEAGNREGAYRLSLEATQKDQGNKEAWLIRAQTAASSEERLVCLNRSIRIDPNHPKAKQALYSTLKSVLEHAPFLAYLDETGQVYFVRNEEYLSLVVPKDRGIPESYPPERPKTLTKAYRWLGWSVVSLALAGVGTLVFAPLAFFLAATTLNQPLKKPDRVRAWLICGLSIMFFAIALVLASLLLVHLLR